MGPDLLPDPPNSLSLEYGKLLRVQARGSGVTAFKQAVLTLCGALVILALLVFAGRALGYW